MKEVKKKSPARIYLTFAVVLIICRLIGGISPVQIHPLQPRCSPAYPASVLPLRHSLDGSICGTMEKKSLQTTGRPHYKMMR